MPNTRPRSDQNTDRLPPHLPDIERAVLGAILWDPKSYPLVAERIAGREQVFYELRHRKIWHRLAQLERNGRPLDSVSLVGALTMAEEINSIGGDAYIAGLQDAGVPENIESYLDQICECYSLRNMLAQLSDGIGAIHERNGRPVREILAHIEQSVFQASQAQSDIETKTIRSVLLHNAELLENYKRGRGLLDGLRSGFGYLDKMTGGLHPGEMIIIAGRPSTGKTSLATNILEHVAIEQNIPCGIFSLEMSAQDIVLRMQCSMSGVDFHQVRTGFATNDDMTKLAEITQRMVNAKVFIDDRPGLDIVEVRARARRWVQRHGVKLVLIDYLQLMHSAGANGRVDEITAVSNGIKGLAKETNVPVIALSQLSRESEKGERGGPSRKPKLSDLRDSGAIEQDADMVGLLYRQHEEKEEREKRERSVEEYRSARAHGLNPAPPLPIPVNLDIAKQRNGPTGDVELMFHRTLMRFEDKYRNRGKADRDDGEGL